MSSFSITPGEHYGYRKTRSLGTPVQHIELIAKAKPGVWKVKFIDGSNAGLTDFARTATLAVPWSEAEAFINDELGLLKVLEASDAQAGHRDETVVTAINSVLEATGDWGLSLLKMPSASSALELLKLQVCAVRILRPCSTL
jgi:hypothetical protein